MIRNTSNLGECVTKDSYCNLSAGCASKRCSCWHPTGSIFTHELAVRVKNHRQDARDVHCTDTALLAEHIRKMMANLMTKGTQVQLSHAPGDSVVHSVGHPRLLQVLVRVVVERCLVPVDPLLID